jgi:rare lipoprotein A
MRDVPMGTRVRVINLENKRSVVLTVNDRGPNAALAAKGRVIDLTRRAFLKLTGKVHADIVKVRVEILKKKELNRP